MWVVAMHLRILWQCRWSDVVFMVIFLLCASTSVRGPEQIQPHSTCLSLASQSKNTLLDLVKVFILRGPKFIRMAKAAPFSR